MIETEPQNIPGRPPMTMATRRFLVRTAVATTVTAALVALFAAVYFDRSWAVRYLLTALWSLGFFGITPMIFKTILLEKRPLAGIGWILFKLLWVALMIWMVSRWAAIARGPMLGSALIAGVTTPLLVAGLRLGGASMQTSKPAKPAQTPAQGSNG
jgi:hypothetical protein